MSNSEIVSLANNGVAIIQRSELRYFKNGRANLHVAISYSVEFQAYTLDLEPMGYGSIDKFNYTSKAEALKYFKNLSKLSNDELLTLIK